MKNRKNSTFLITSTKKKSFGTGFCIHKDTNGSFLLTCAHIVNSCGKDNLQVESHKAILLHSSKDNDIIDLALIYVENLIDTTPLKLYNEIINIDNDNKSNVFDIDGFRLHKNNYAKEPLKGYIKKSYTQESKDNKEWIYELSIDEGDSIEQGYSGSAVVCSQTGLVIAVATDRKIDGKKAYATPVTYLKYIWKYIPSTIYESNETTNPYKGLNSFEYTDRSNYYG